MIKIQKKFKPSEIENRKNEWVKFLTECQSVKLILEEIKEVKKISESNIKLLLLIEKINNSFYKRVFSSCEKSLFSCEMKFTWWLILIITLVLSFIEWFFIYWDFSSAFIEPWIRIYQITLLLLNLFPAFYISNILKPINDQLIKKIPELCWVKKDYVVSCKTNLTNNPDIILEIINEIFWPEGIEPIYNKLKEAWDSELSTLAAMIKDKSWEISEIVLNIEQYLRNQ